MGESKKSKLEPQTNQSQGQGRHRAGRQEHQGGEQTGEGKEKIITRRWMLKDEQCKDVNMMWQWNIAKWISYILLKEEAVGEKEGMNE